MKNAEILADSLNVKTGDRLTTFLLPRFPKVLLQELNTHRMLSRNAASSRAIPIEKMIERVLDDPYIPVWTANQKGMQGKLLDDEAAIISARDEWNDAMHSAITHVNNLDMMGIHKQNANRLLEPFMRVPVIVSGTEWSNFFELRCDEACHPDFRSVAREMRQLRDNNKPAKLQPGEWHIPFSGFMDPDTTNADELAIATARCARISYSTHDGEHDIDKDVALHDRLLASRHMSPFEHCAMATGDDFVVSPPLRGENVLYTRNYDGFYSYRAHIEDGVKP